MTEESVKYEQGDLVEVIVDGNTQAVAAIAVDHVRFLLMGEGASGGVRASRYVKVKSVLRKRVDIITDCLGAYWEAHHEMKGDTA